MNNIFSRNHVFSLIGLASLAFLSTNASAVAQTSNVTNNQRLTQALNRNSSLQQVDTAELQQTLASNPNQATVDGSNITQANLAVPVPGTTTTSSAALLESATPVFQPLNQPSNQPASQPAKTEVAQADIDPGRRTRGGSSYVGVAGNIGISGGDSALGDGNFAVISKIGLTSGFSVRPSAVFGDNTAVLIPVTYDFSLDSVNDPFAEPLAIAPYVGAGVALKTNDGAQVAFLVSGGVDFPLTPQFTATAAINAGFFDETDIGVLVGVGYNFNGL